MLEVNGGKQVKDDPRTDRNSDTCPHSSNAPGERSSGGSSSSGGPNKGEERSPTQGGGAPRTECSPPAKRDTSSGGSPGRSSSSGRESGDSSDSKPSNPGGVNKGEERSPTQGGGAPRTECSPPSKRETSGGGGSFDRGERDRDSDRDSGSSGGGGSGYHPPAQSQPAPEPNKGEETSPTQGGGAPRGGETPSEQKQPKITQGAEKQDGEKLKNFFNSENNVGIKPDMNFPIDMSKVTNIGEYGPREKIEIGDEETKPFHGGMDFAAPADTDIFSATDGWVRENGNNNIYGNYVVISDDKGWSGTLTYYAHMNEASDFTVGTQVEKGQKIGSVGSTGLSTGPHLHFEVRTNYGQTKHDPRDFLPFLTQTGSFE